MNRKQAYILFTMAYISFQNVFADDSSGMTLLPSRSSNPELAEKIHSGSIEMYDIPGYIVHLLDTAVWIAYFLAMLSVMYAGVLYIKSMFGGDSDQEGKERIPKVITGIAIVAFSWIIVDILLQITSLHNL